MATRVDVYLEVGTKRTFAAALDWPGWCRQGPTETDALAALLAYGPKYATILAGTRLGFVAPKDVAQLVVVERLPGTATTDFGALSVAPTVDRDRSCDGATLKRFETILGAGWRAFDEAAKSARGKTLATGPRGGGRSLEAIVTHVIGADAGYLGAVGWKAPRAAKAAKPTEQLAATRGAILAALTAARRPAGEYDASNRTFSRTMARRSPSYRRFPSADATRLLGVARLIHPTTGGECSTYERPGKPQRASMERFAHRQSEERRTTRRHCAVG